MSSFVRVRHPGGEELNVDLIELEDALQGVAPGNCYLLPRSGRIIFLSSDEVEDEMEDEGEQVVIPDDEEALPIDKIESGVSFRWDGGIH